MTGAASENAYRSRRRATDYLPKAVRGCLPRKEGQLCLKRLHQRAQFTGENDEQKNETSEQSGRYELGLPAP